MEMNHHYIGTEHLLLGVIADRNSLATQLLRRMEINIYGMKDSLLKELYTRHDKLPTVISMHTQFVLWHAERLLNLQEMLSLIENDVVKHGAASDAGSLNVLSDELDSLATQLETLSPRIRKHVKKLHSLINQITT